MLRLTITSGALRAGDKIISARKLAEREHVSLPTALEALRCLEAEGLIVARPRSGYYIHQTSLPQPVEPSRSPPGPVPVTLSAMARSLFSSSEARLVPLGAALPDPAWLPGETLQRALHSAGRRLDAHGQSYSLPPGRRDLRSKIAARSAQWGARFSADDLIITAGATQALRLALRAVCQPGDVVAIEQPAYFGTLLLLEDLGLKALSIPTDPVEGLLLEPLADAIRCHRRPPFWPPTVQNPLGASMPVTRKQELVALLDAADIPLIEDDVYGDLVGEGNVPQPVKRSTRVEMSFIAAPCLKRLRPAGESAGLPPDATFRRFYRPAWPETGQALRCWKPQRAKSWRAAITIAICGGSSVALRRE
jgi:DNA-binding transcriptional MocR family regulator